jgi:hypothetical protein
MSSGLRTLANPGLYYVSVDVNDALHYVLSNGTWDVSTTDMGDKIFRDLGKTVYFHPVNSLTTGEGAPAAVAQTAPPVDVRLVAEVDSSGVGGNSTTYYIPLGTRVRGTRAQQESIPSSCWVAQAAAGVVSLRGGRV